MVREKGKFNLHKLKLTQQQQNHYMKWFSLCSEFSNLKNKKRKKTKKEKKRKERERERERETDSWRLEEVRMESLRVSISQPWMQRLRRPSGKGSALVALSSFSSTSTIHRKNSFKKIGIILTGIFL